MCDTPSWTTTSTQTNNTALLDSGASLHLLRTDAPYELSILQNGAKTVTIPNGKTMTTTKTVKLALDNLPNIAKIANILPGLHNNLISVAALCKAGCSVKFTTNDCLVLYKNKVVLRGWRDSTNNLWRVPLTSNKDEQQSSQAHSIYECEQTSQLIKFYHAAAFSPTKMTWLKAVQNGYFRGWPGLTPDAIKKHIHTEEATIMGHLNQKQQGLRSTKTNNNHTDDCPQEPNNEKTNEVYIAMEDVQGKLYSDQTGAFPRTSRRGNKYLAIFYAYDANYIRAVPLKSKTAAELQTAYEDVYTELTAKGFKPMLHKFDTVH